MTDNAEPRQTAANDVFGEPLPESSSDDRDTDPCNDAAGHDRWLQDNVPPHYR